MMMGSAGIPDVELGQALFDTNELLSFMLRHFSEFRKCGVINDDICSNLHKLVKEINEYITDEKIVHTDAKPTFQDSDFLKKNSIFSTHYAVASSFHCRACGVDLSKKSLSKHTKSRNHISNLSEDMTPKKQHRSKPKDEKKVKSSQKKEHQPYMQEIIEMQEMIEELDVNTPPKIKLRTLKYELFLQYHSIRDVFNGVFFWCTFCNCRARNEAAHTLTRTHKEKSKLYPANTAKNEIFLLMGKFCILCKEFLEINNEKVLAHIKSEDHLSKFSKNRKGARIEYDSD